MPLSLLHKGRRKWMGRREKSGTSPADGRAQNAGTPPPVQAGRRRGPLHSARGASKAGGPVCRPYGFMRGHLSIERAGLGPAPTADTKRLHFSRRGRTLAGPTVETGPGR